MTDPFGTAAIRERVLAAWAASPARFREDANAEEDFARTGYRDRLVVELAQNAVDAAAAAGVPARLLLQVTDRGLYAANTGVPLTAAGVEALSHLRASTKHAGHVGRFGVGFKAVLAVTDEPAVVSWSGGVRWSRAESLALAAGHTTLREELARRGDAVPVMRLPFPATPDETARALLAEGYDTVVVLPWRDATTAAIGAELVAAIDPTLPLFLPGLAETRLRSPAGDQLLAAAWDGERVRLGREQWWVRRRTGELPAALLADRPVEERERSTWQVTWALRLERDHPVPLLADADRRLRAPQPTDEPLTVPALLSASVPLDTARRHVVSWPLADFVLQRAAVLYLELLTEAAATPELLDLVPLGLPAGQVDAVLREAVADRLGVAALFGSAGDAEVRLRPREAAVVDAGPASASLTELLSPLFPQLVDPAYGRRHGALAALGVRRLSTSDVVDLLSAVDQPPSWWARVYAAVGSATDRDALGALPVPLADGRMAAGPRGLLLPTAGVDLSALTAAGLPMRAVHPDAAEGDGGEVLRRLGAVDADPAALLDEPALHTAVLASLDDEPPVDPDLLAEAVLTLAAAAPAAAAGRSWLADLALRNAEGELQPAGELLLPVWAGGRLAALVDPDAPFGVVAGDVVERYGADALAAVGVLRTFALVRDEDVPADAGSAEHYLDGEEQWLATLGGDGSGSVDAPPLVTELVAVRDLEWVRADAWGDALAELAGSSLRAAVLDPARLVLADGASAHAGSYTRWWLDTHACVPVTGGGLARPPDLRAPDAEPLLAGLYDGGSSLPGAALELVAQLGAVRTVSGLLAGGVGALVDLLDRLADPARPVTRAQLAALYGPVAAALADLTDPDDLPAIERVRGIVRGRELVVVAPADAVLVDTPDLLPLVGDRPVVPVPLPLTAQAHQVLEVPLATALSSYDVCSVCVATQRWGDLPGFPATVARLGMEHDPLAALVAEATFEEHSELAVRDASGAECRVAWRLLEGRAAVSRADFVHGASRALATLLGRWTDRHAVAAMLAYPDRAGDLLAEAELD